MGDLVSSPVEFTQEEYDLIHKALETYEKRCKVYAKLCLNNGYRTAVSEAKAEKFIEEAEFAREIDSKIGYSFI